LSPLEIAAVTHATVAALFTGVCAFASRSRKPRVPKARPKVVLLRPIEALTPTLTARFAEDRESYSGELTCVICAPKPIVAPSSIRVAASHVGELDPVNRKAAHLAAGLELVRAELAADTVVVHADSDVSLRPGDLDALIDALEGPRSIAFAPPVPTGNTWLRRSLAQSIVALSPQAFAAIAALSRMTGAPPAIAGKLVAIPSPLLAELGGYACMMHRIGDDVALVEAVREKGASVHMSDRAAVTVNDMDTWQLFGQLTRWFRVIAAHRLRLLSTYPLLIAPLPIALVLCVLANTSRAYAVLAALSFSRLVLGVVLARGVYRNRVDLRNVLFAPLADALVLVAAVRALFGRSIVWAGRTYRVGRGGRILEVR
jgi:Glycosyl transferase family 21